MARRHARRSSDVEQLSFFGEPEPVAASSERSAFRVRRSCSFGHVWVVANQLSFDGQTDYTVEYCAVCGVYRRSC
ncbi:MAG TPA: hypothetical protein VFV38_11820 [Ktedonobacteraceae bacterium]|nr:hypothetical protein [Ktedonobacteraceae bacterium]